MAIVSACTSLRRRYPFISAAQSGAGALNFSAYRGAFAVE